MHKVIYLQTNHNNMASEDIFYKLGKIIFFPVCIILILLYHLTASQFLSLPECIILKNYHIYCPGCGATRALFYLVHLNFQKSFLYHPFVIYTFFVYITFMMRCFYYRHLSKKLHKKIRIERYLYFGALLILVQCVIKNYLYLKLGYTL